MKKTILILISILYLLETEAQTSVSLTKLDKTTGVFRDFVIESEPNDAMDNDFKLKHHLDSSATLVWKIGLYKDGKYDTLTVKFLTGVKGDYKYIQACNLPTWQPDFNRLFVIHETDSSQVLQFKREKGDLDIFKIHIYSFIKRIDNNQYVVGKFPFQLSYAEHYEGELFYKDKNYKLLMRDLSPIERKGDMIDFKFLSNIDTFSSSRDGERDSNWIKIDSTFFRFTLSKRLDTLYLFPFKKQEIPTILSSLPVFDLKNNQKIDIIKSREKDYLFIDLWGTWCGGCIKDMPNLVDKYNKYGSEMEFISIAFRSDLEKIPEILIKNKISWNQYYLPKINEGWFSKYTAMGFPGVIILDKNNKIIFDSNNKFNTIKLEPLLNSLKK